MGRGSGPHVPEFEPYRLTQARHLAGMSRDDLAAAIGVRPWQILQCTRYGIRLAAEYERKIAYNRTRPYQHGGRTLNGAGQVSPG